MELECFLQIKKNIQLYNLMEIFSMRDELFHVDGQTDRMNLIAFHNFVNSPDNDIVSVGFFSRKKLKHGCR